MKKKALLMVSIIGLVLAIYRCDSNYFGRLLTRNTVIPPTDSTTTTTPCPPGADCTQSYFANADTYTQQVQTSSTAADIVFVLDRSGSMSDNVQALTTSLQTWFTTLETLGLPNYCVGLLPAISEDKDGAMTGVLQANAGHSCFCRFNDDGSENMTVAQIQSNFGSAVSSTPTLNGNSQVEDGLYAVHRALSDRLATNQASGDCMLGKKALVVFDMSDEQDVGVSSDTGTSCNYNAPKADGTMVNLNSVMFDNSFTKYGQNGWATDKSTQRAAVNYNPIDCSEAAERLLRYSDPTPDPVTGKYVNLITPKSVTDQIFTFNSNFPTYSNSIGHVPGSSSSDVNESPFHGGIEFADIFGQAIIDINIATPSTQAQFNARMNQIAADLVKQLSYQHVFVLVDKDGKPTTVCAGQEDSLKVKVNTTPLASSQYTLNSARNQVTVASSVVFKDQDQVYLSFTSCTN